MRGDMAMDETTGQAKGSDESAAPGPIDAGDSATPSASTPIQSPDVMRTRAKPLLASALIVLALGITATIWHATDHPAPGASSTSHGSDGVRSVRIDDFTGKLTVTGGGSTQIAATAQPVSGDQAPGLEFHLDAATKVLTLACFDQHRADKVPCPATEYKITLPAGIGMTLTMRDGQATLTGLDGPVAITASSAYVDAQALRTPAFTAAITNGTLNAAFTRPPTRVAVDVASAQATLRLPRTATYSVQQQVTSAYVQVALPQSPTATHRVLATANSGEISLLTD